MEDIAKAIAAETDREKRIALIRDLSREASGYYRHYKGGIYVVDCLAAREEDGVAVVVYRNKDDWRFTRPLAEFAEKFGRLVP